MSITFQDESDEYNMLPPIDISGSEARIKQFKQDIDEGISQFSNKLMYLKTIAIDAGDELELQNKEITRMNSKVTSETTSLLKMNKQTDEIIEQIGTSTKLCFIFILVAILLVILFILFVYLAITL
jgi:ATP-dependent Zn protease